MIDLPFAAWRAVFLLAAFSVLAFAQGSGRFLLQEKFATLIGPWIGRARDGRGGLLSKAGAQHDTAGFLGKIPFSNLAQGELRGTGRRECAYPHPASPACL
jgi:hypothetical protein